MSQRSRPEAARPDLPGPARPRLRSAGTVVLALCIGCASCERSDQGAASEPRVLELDSARLQLPDTIQLAVIELDRSLPADLQPATIEIRVGDIVRFEARDAASHAVAFEGTGLSAEARRFLEVTGQMRSPPLLAPGNAWVVSFANAPPGDYPFRCATHGAAGRVAVRAR